MIARVIHSLLAVSSAGLLVLFAGLLAPWIGRPATPAYAQFQGGRFGFCGFQFGGGLPGFQGGFQGFQLGGFQGGCGVQFGGFQFGGFNFGGFQLLSPPPPVTVEEQVPLVVTYVLPAPRTWQELRTLEIRFRDEGNATAFWVRWDQAQGVYELIDPVTGNVVASGRPGGSGALETSQWRLLLDDSPTQNSGATGQAVALQLTLVPLSPASNRTFRVEFRAVSDQNEVLGFSTVGPLAVIDKPSDEQSRKLTEEQRHQRERTNTNSLDDWRTEGNVVRAVCDADQPYVVIANRDGEVVVHLLYEARKSCRNELVGSYGMFMGPKVHEQLYEAHEASYEASIRPRRQ